ncbi:hypothetical protein LINPERHAP1_LOCUS6522 [Linum perenne]
MAGPAPSSLYMVKPYQGFIGPRVVDQGAMGKGQPWKAKCPASSFRKVKEEVDDTMEEEQFVFTRVARFKHGEEARVLKMRLEVTGMATNAAFYKAFASSSPGSKGAILEASMMKPKKPSFMVVVKQNNVTYRTLYFPKMFWRMHMVDDQMPTTSTGGG